MQFNVIYTDNPWEFRNEKTGGSMKSGAKWVYGAKGKYNVMNLNDLKQLKINSITRDNALLFMWIPSPLLPEGFEVMKSWGFKYKFSIYWLKEYGGNKYGMGAWLRNHIEILAVGIKGKVSASHIHKRNVITHKVLRHSEKPEVFRKLIEEIAKKSFNRPNYIELFARRTVPHWETLGYEIDGFDIRDSLINIASLP